MLAIETLLLFFSAGYLLFSIIPSKKFATFKVLKKITMISQSFAIRSQSQKPWNLWYSWLCFFNCEGTRDLTDVPASINDIKTQPDVLTLSSTFYDHSVSHNFSSKAEMRKFGAAGTKGLMDFRDCNIFENLEHWDSRIGTGRIGTK